MILLILGFLIALSLFFYFQKRTTNRNIDHFEKSRKRFDQLVDTLKKNNTDPGAEETKPDNKEN